MVHLCDYLASRKDIEVLFDSGDKTLTLDVNTYKLTFGRYKGMTLIEVSQQDPSYIEWAKNNLTKEPVRSLLKNL